MPNDKNPIARAFNVQSAFFIPVWRRILVVAVTLVWALFELIMGGPIWAIVFLVIAIYCAHQFFIVFDPVKKDE